MLLKSNPFLMLPAMKFLKQINTTMHSLSTSSYYGFFLSVLKSLMMEIGLEINGDTYSLAISLSVCGMTEAFAD